MTTTYRNLHFTPSVQAVQKEQGTHRPLPPTPGERDELGPVERKFIEARDGFYVASVNTDGWPYVQFRGGPAGFLKALDSKTLGFADFRGNRQYITTGNVREDDRVALFFMDYANQARLKLSAHAEIVTAEERPELFAALVPEDYPAVVERLVLYHVVAFDWNCPQHITPRFTADEWALLQAQAPPQ